MVSEVNKDPGRKARIVSDDVTFDVPSDRDYGFPHYHYEVELVKDGTGWKPQFKSRPDDDTYDGKNLDIYVNGSSRRVFMTVNTDNGVNWSFAVRPIRLGKSADGSHPYSDLATTYDEQTRRCEQLSFNAWYRGKSGATKGKKDPYNLVFIVITQNADGSTTAETLTYDPDIKNPGDNL